ncbi:MAG TPA: MBL fold metallo-hydrolase [Candidatus Thermoplasmatota archaeon]|nr:MBL fold metallo-hydrolase [Candidatus Thermoplasmatota archaeon]
MADSITAEALRQRMDKGEKLSILDVRDKEDFAEWRIPGALHCDAYDDLSAGRPGAVQTFALLPRDRLVVAVCYAGHTSRYAADVLKARGFQAVSLQGGMNGWSTAWNAAEVSGAAGARVIQVRRTGKGCLSYLVGSEGEAAVIDPSLDPSIYLELAREKGWTIKHVLETHVHADHLSRARALSSAAAASLHVPRTERIRFSALAVDEGTRIKVGAHELVAMRTPGHTNESTCYLLDQKLLFTGDTLFLDAIGRPDLEADRQQATSRALTLHATLERLQKLPPETLVLPCHTSAPVPFDKRPLVAQLHQVRARTPMLALPRNEFVARILDKLPETPPNHKLIVKANEAGDASGLDASVEAGANRCAVH